MKGIISPLAFESNNLIIFIYISCLVRGDTNQGVECSLLSSLVNSGLLQGAKLCQINPIVGKSFRSFIGTRTKSGTEKAKSTEPLISH